MTLEAMVLKDDRREYESGGTKKVFRRVHMFATPEDGFCDPITAEVPVDTPPLQPRSVVIAQIAGIRAFGREVTFVVSRLTGLTEK